MRSNGRRMYGLAAGVGAQKYLEGKPSLKWNNSETIQHTNILSAVKLYYSVRPNNWCNWLRAETN
jgi:hypothetical protein